MINGNVLDKWKKFRGNRIILISLIDKSKLPRLVTEFQGAGFSNQTKQVLSGLITDRLITLGRHLSRDMVIMYRALIWQVTRMHWSKISSTCVLTQPKVGYRAERCIPKLAMLLISMLFPALDLLVARTSSSIKLPLCWTTKRKELKSSLRNVDKYRQQLSPLTQGQDDLPSTRIRLYIQLAIRAIRSLCCLVL